MLFHCLQTQTGVFSDLLVAASFTGQLRDFPFAPCEPGDGWQAEKAKSPGPFTVPATIFAGDEKMWSGDSGRFDLS
jgi:hypothetical protein